MENLGIDYKLFIAQVINFALFFYVVKRFIVKPMFKVINDEKNKEEERDRCVAEAKRKEEEMTTKKTEILSQVREDAEKELKQTKAEAEKMKEYVLSEAREEAKEIVESAKKQIEIERQNFYRDMKKQAADISILLINQSLDGYLTEAIQKQLTAHVLTSLPEKITIDG